MKYIKFSYLVFAAAIFLSSCEKQLEQNDPQSFSDENAFRTIEDIQLGVNGAFAGYATDAGDWWKTSLTSDETKIGPDNAGGGALTFRYQYSSDNTSGADVIRGYYGFYSMIDQVNRVLPHIDKVTGGTADRKNELKAHLLGLRAIGHFGLLQSFCKNYDPAGLGIAVMTEFNPAARPARNTMGEVMAQIDADLTTARSLLPQTTASNFTDTVFNQVNIAAFQARIALYKGDYDAAIAFSTEVINSGVVALASGTDYQNIWTDDSYSESLFRIRFGTSQGVGGLWTGNGNAAQMSPSDKLTSSYDPADIRLTTFIGYNSVGNRYVKKHSVSNRGALRVDLKACRLSEIYLIRAEAYAKRSSPDLAAGAADLNEIRANRIFGYVDESFATSQNLVDAILQERFKELCFEGFRFYDLKRNNLPVERDASDASPAWQTLPATSHLFVYPIPQDAILGNPNTRQNEGY